MVYAVINNNIVTEIVEIFEELKVIEKGEACQNLIDITNTSPRPTIGYIFDGLYLSYSGE